MRPFPPNCARSIDGNIGVHSTRKGVANYCFSGTTTGVSFAALCARTGWSMVMAVQVSAVINCGMHELPTVVFDLSSILSERTNPTRCWLKLAVPVIL